MYICIYMYVCIARKIGWSPKNVYSYDNTNDDDESIDGISVGSIRKCTLNVYVCIYIYVYVYTYTFMNADLANI
jgi:hypothetical protein